LMEKGQLKLPFLGSLTIARELARFSRTIAPCFWKRESLPRRHSSWRPKDARTAFFNGPMPMPKTV
jgi:hypothetical protein